MDFMERSNSESSAVEFLQTHLIAERLFLSNRTGRDAGQLNSVSRRNVRPLQKFGNTYKVDKKKVVRRINPPGNSTRCSPLYRFIKQSLSSFERESPNGFRK